ncbi:CopY/TcrY family copper transport repressor [Lapidilactobacillus achengensis]|uniref:CopY/TcrY family copper transport repressor n=1 Tax=Lapidilactobacillus achengensis TaxID=2486000 RepID=A0ABW1ULS4_9LACO|nr:CopY/TcrY family copper transport repressor [Lapidilactobacillus achengensis]
MTSTQPENLPEISPAEWEVMRIVWTLNGAQTHELISSLQEKMDWTESTIKTLIRRLQQKGYLERQGTQRPYVYQATITEQAGINQQTDALFANLCAMHVGPTLIRLVKNNTLSQQDLTELSQLIATKQATAPAVVACDCLADCQVENQGECHE